MPQVDPVTGFNFLVEFGEDPGSPAAAFRHCEGLGGSIDVVEYRVGNARTNGVQKLPGLRRYTNVVLKRGITTDLTLWTWFQNEPPETRDVVITLVDFQHTPLLRFGLRDAWPCKWEGPALDAQGSEVAIETLELAHEGLQVSAG